MEQPTVQSILTTTEVFSRPQSDAGRKIAVACALLAGVAGLMLLSICVGTRAVAPIDALRAFTDYVPTDNDHLVVRDVRLPRTLLAMAVGAALGTAGTLIQTMTRNPLAEPGILGVTAGAGFALTVSVAAWQISGQLPQLVLAFVGSLIAAIAVYAVGRTSPLHLLLAGVALSAVLVGLSLGLQLTKPDVYDRYRFWAVGSLAGREQTDLTIPVVVIVVCLFGALAVTRPLGTLTLGEQVAHSLGTRVAATRVAVLLLVTILTAVATAIAGPIAFVGLIVPHLSRRLATGSVPWLVIYTMLIGPILLIGSDVIARLLLPTGEVPVAIVTAFLGGPMLIWVVRRYGAMTL